MQQFHNNIHSSNHNNNNNNNPTIDGNTHIFGLLGRHLSYSLSFQIHNSAFQYFDQNSVYIPFVLPEDNHAQSFLDAILHSKTNLHGLNITTPYKSTFVQHPLIHSSESVQRTGSMNTLIKKEDYWMAENSDIIGFIRSIAHLDLRGRDILILGAGGVARSVLYALKTRT